jgi:hypothetical protein
VMASHTKFHEDWFGHSDNIKGYYFDNLRGCSVCTIGRNFLNMPLRWSQVA